MTKPEINVSKRSVFHILFSIANILQVGLLQSLDHPNIIKYMDSFINENNLVIIVEWAAAGDLKRQLRKAQERQTGFDERIIWKYFSQIADAIQHMHEKRIMHRDLKPANIFLTLDGTVKVGDLGLSRELSENTYQAHSKVGTPLYMSPEVLRGDGYDFKSDIWSIGCLLYELAMLKSPFKSEGLNLYSLFQKISQGEYSPLPDRYSDELRRLTYAMISTNPEDRPDIADICREARAMRVKYNEEYLRRKQQQQQQQQDEKDDDDKSHDAERADSARGRRGSDARENKFDSSPNSTVSKVTTTSEPPPEAQPSSGRRKSAEKRRGGRRGDSDNEDEGGAEEGKWGGSRSRRTAGHGGGGSDEEDSAATENTRSNTRPNNLTPPKKYDGREDRGGHAKTSSDSISSRQAVVSNKPPPSLRPTKSPGDAADDFIPYTKPSAQQSLSSHQTQQSASPKKPQQAVQRRRKEQPVPGGTSGSRSTAAQNGTQGARNPSVGGGTELNFDDDDLADAADSFNEVDKKGGVSKLANSGAAFAMMDIAYGKLLALGYPLYTDSGRCKITPIHFASDTASLFGRAKTSFPSTQFGSFVEVCLWLVGKTNGTGTYGGHIDIDADPPATIVRQLLRFAQV
jgi:serine/threonine protein kinase